MNEIRARRMEEQKERMQDERKGLDDLADELFPFLKG